jgi:alpha-tubulin suppressor-like RCC1 family protein
VLKDLSYAAAVLAVAHGPSGPNAAYLHNLYDFLQAQPSGGDRGADSSATRTDPLEQKDAVADDDTLRLTRLVDHYQREGLQFFFGYGGGSNQHNQLLLQHLADHLLRGEEAHVVTEILLAAPPSRLQKTYPSDEVPVALLAGGGHSALVTTHGRLFLFGWNEAGQCGALHNEDANTAEATMTTTENPPMGWEFPHRVGHVATCALGFAHTLAGDDQGRLWALGDNTKGQVTGSATKEPIQSPILVKATLNKKVVAVAAGLFHSAAVTNEGEVVEWGGATTRQWRPATNDSALIGVACGRKHTLAWNVNGQLWSWGTDSKNKYGQLGRSGEAETPALVDVPWTLGSHVIVDVQCGWSHCVALVQDMTTQERVLYGWGRNDKGQLGLDPTVHGTVPRPVPLSLPHVRSFTCGSEFTMAVSGDDESLWACGWNEHGNLGIGTAEEEFVATWHAVPTGQLAQPPGTLAADSYPVQVAAGGAHFFAARVSPSTPTVS